MTMVVDTSQPQKPYCALFGVPKGSVPVRPDVEQHSPEPGGRSPAAVPGARHLHVGHAPSCIVGEWGINWIHS